MQGDIADQVAKLVQEGQPLQAALEKTTQEFMGAMSKFMENASRADSQSGLQDMIAQLVDLQRQSNQTQSRILQNTVN